VNIYTVVLDKMARKF